MWEYIKTFSIPTRIYNFIVKEEVDEQALYEDLRYGQAAGPVCDVEVSVERWRFDVNAKKD